MWSLIFTYRSVHIEAETLAKNQPSIGPIMHLVCCGIRREATCLP